MNRATLLALDAVNRAFYDARAAEFSATREAPWPGWERALGALGGLHPARAGRTLRILDVGCGSGRLCPWIGERLRLPHHYVGLDRSLPLLAIARRERAAAHWIVADLLASDGALPCRDAAFDAVVAFGLLHHLPSFTLRRALVRDLLRLVPPGGRVALAFWQFGSDPRFERHVLPWERAPGVDRGQIEPGDRLLRWGGDETASNAGAMRYCHYADPAEADRLTAGLPAEVVDTFRADGRSGELNLYRILLRA